MALRHKGELKDWIATRAERQGASDPARAARRAMILVEGMGMIIRYQMTGDLAVVEEGRPMLAGLLGRARPRLRAGPRRRSSRRP